MSFNQPLPPADAAVVTTNDYHYSTNYHHNSHAQRPPPHFPQHQPQFPPPQLPNAANTITNPHNAVLTVANVPSTTTAAPTTSPVIISYDAAVDLSHRGIALFPQVAHSLPNCVSLNLSGNHLQRFRSEVQSRHPDDPSGSGSSSSSSSSSSVTSRVRSLNVSRNRLQSLLDLNVAFGLVEVLNLSHNQLTSVEPLRMLTRLQQLDVSHNQLVSLDHLGATQSDGLPGNGHGGGISSFGSSGCLRELRAAHNRIRTLPDLSLCSALEVVDMSSNEIAETEEVHRLMPVQSLQHLDLSQNRIHKLCHLTTLAALKKLRHLAIQGNPCWVSHKFYSRQKCCCCFLRMYTVVFGPGCCYSCAGKPATFRCVLGTVTGAP